MSALRYSAKWIESAPNAVAEERATVADLGLWVDSKNVAMHLRGTTSFDHITISLYPLAEGLAQDWWTIFGGRDREFSLIRYRSGYVVPDVRLKFDGVCFEISAHQRSYANPDVRFWAGPTEIISRAQAEQEFGNFIELVLERLAEKRIKNTSAALRWSRIKSSRLDPEETQFCESAGALGRDPYQVEDAYVSFIQESASLFEGEPLSEFLAGSREYRKDALLEWIEFVEKRPRHKSRVGELKDIALKAADSSPTRIGERSWELGYRRARAMRRVLDLGPEVHFPTFKDLARKFGASDGYELASSVDGIRALRSDHNNEVRIHIRNHGHSSEAYAAHLFTFARAVGDVACFPQSTKAPINELHSASRQAAGRAFAAEFLAPIDEVKSMHKDGYDIVSIADKFVVSTVVIEHQMENAERIGAACN